MKQVTFGRHAGKDFDKVPAPYLLWFYAQAWSKDKDHAELRYYTTCNLEDIKSKVEAIERAKKGKAKQTRPTLKGSIELELYTPADHAAPCPADEALGPEVGVWPGRCMDEHIAGKCVYQCKLCKHDQ